MSHLYKVTVIEGQHQYVQADSKNQARQTVVQRIVVDKLDASEAVRLTLRGIAIVSAETGRVCNADIEDDEDPTTASQQPLPGVE